VQRLLEATKETFLTRGFAGTTVDAIAQAAGVSRATFYTYFESTREALIALGSGAVDKANTMVQELRSLPTHPTKEDLDGFVQKFFTVLDETGSFAVAWSQAANHDTQLRALGVREHLRLSEQIGQVLGELRQADFEDPTAQGFLLQCAVERAWFFCRLCDDPQLTRRIQRQIAKDLFAVMSSP
jgi:TetR/AcrR family transcriptional regulator